MSAETIAAVVMAAATSMFVAMAVAVLVAGQLKAGDRGMHGHFSFHWPPDWARGRRYHRMSQAERRIWRGHTEELHVSRRDELGRWVPQDRWTAVA